MNDTADQWRIGMHRHKGPWSIGLASPRDVCRCYWSIFLASGNETYRARRFLAIIPVVAMLVVLGFGSQLSFHPFVNAVIVVLLYYALIVMIPALLLCSEWFRSSIGMPSRWSMRKCLRCNYDLTGTSGGVCSGCGAPSCVILRGQ